MAIPAPPPRIDRRLRDSERPFRRILLVWLVVATLFLLSAIQNILESRFPDPDDVLRLVQVRDLLEGQAWFDLKQHRIDPLGHVPMHWSRLVDIPIALVIAGLTPILGQGVAEQAAVILVPLLTLLATMMLIGHMAWRLFDKEVAGLACLAMGFLPLIVFQFQPLRIDHHGWQILTVVAAIWAIHRRNAWTGGALAGFAMAAGIAISLEILPIAALFGGVLALRWLRDPARRFWLVGYLQSLAASLLVLFAATRGFADLALYCDAVTLPHIGFFAVVAAFATGLACFPRLPWIAIAGGFAVAGGAGLLGFGTWSPECVRTPFGSLDPLVHELWYINVLEGRPIWDQPPVMYAQLFQILVGFGVGVYLWRKAAAWKRDWWQDYLLVFAGTILLGLLVWRSMAFASVLAAIPLGYVIRLGLEVVRAGEQWKHRLLVVAALAVVLLPTVPFGVTGILSQNVEPEETTPAEGPAIEGQLSLSSCDLFDSADKLAALKTATIFAPLDIGPALIQRSPHSVVATGHHRAEAAMRDVMDGFLASPAEARAIIGKHQARYIVVCTDILEPNLYASRGGADSLAHGLVSGNAPDWLEPVALDTPETFKVWRVLE